MDFVGGDLLKSVASRVMSELIVDRFRLWFVRVDGVEVTQAIQYYKAEDHLSDAADRGPDNSVQLVANKPAWVRVYLRSGLLPQMPGVTGTLLVERRRSGLIWGTVGDVDAAAAGHRHRLLLRHLPARAGQRREHVELCRSGRAVRRRAPTDGDAHRPRRSQLRLGDVDGRRYAAADAAAARHPHQLRRTQHR
jgi:hypothetical protein